jgi:hypothetical protein
MENVSMSQQSQSAFAGSKRPYAPSQRGKEIIASKLLIVLDE